MDNHSLSVEMPDTNSAKPISADPQLIDWKSLELPDAWPDQNQQGNQLWNIIKKALSKHRSPVEIPEHMPGADNIPKYILQEFHNLPNGNYSKRLTRGYISSLDKMMLGTLQQARKTIAEQLSGRDRVLDVGCSSGHLAAAVQSLGASDVWGIDPSPYLLQHGAHDYPNLKLVQGLAEKTGFPDQRFQAVCCCFLLHELPPRYLNQALAEFARICEPGALLCIAEPSPEQLYSSPWQLIKRHGLKGLYFYVLAARVYEPFVHAWHALNFPALLQQHGFELLSDVDQLPIRAITARRLK